MVDEVYFDPDGAKWFVNTAMVEWLLGGVGVLMSEDGTYQFAENDTYPDVVYSPRLPPVELEQFCKDNLAKYHQYNALYEHLFDAGEEAPPIERFWEK